MGSEVLLLFLTGRPAWRAAWQTAEVTTPPSPGPVDLGTWSGPMAMALRQAAEAALVGDVPVGAVVTDGDGQIIGMGMNQRVANNDPLAHAEIEALRSAAENRGSWRLDDATLVVTLEPCPMCAGAALQARIRRIVFGTPDPKAGACGSLYNLAADPRLPYPEIEVVGGVDAKRSAELLGSFFETRR